MAARKKSKKSQRNQTTGLGKQSAPSISGLSAAATSSSMLDAASTNDMLKAASTNDMMDATSPNDMLKPASTNDMLAVSSTSGKSATTSSKLDAASTNDMLKAASTNDIMDVTSTNDMLKPTSTNDMLAVSSTSGKSAVASASGMLKPASTKDMLDVSSTSDKPATESSSGTSAATSANDMLKAASTNSMIDAPSTNGMSAATSTSGNTVADPSTSSVNETPVAWTKDEKFKLYQGLRLYGSADLEGLSKSVPTKTKKQIKQRLDELRKVAFQDPVIAEGNKRVKLAQQKHAKAPLISWAKILTDNTPFEGLKTETANALRLIAMFEEFPHAAATEGIDFRAVYHALANAMEGKSLQEDWTVAMVLDKCFTETALVSKSFMNSTQLLNNLENYLVSLKSNHKEVSQFNKADDSPAQAALRHLATKSNYNPLGISQSDLQLN